MRHLSDEDRKIIEEEMLIEADRRRHERFWNDHWELLSFLPAKARDAIMLIEVLVLGVPLIVIFIYALLSH